ncbi:MULTISPECIES: hydroxyethylthiazole kinase [unclassified Tatumella]|uniref:hydroxyethylthiazole kinase n=1 Tax=unclassified Tatumella TaxID=2649542 RepID=UPI001BAFA0D6|nr:MULTISPECIES: hydroxyethylthiazole kinase [unclassified Tatumella]MBS0876509.1 hydroxyethylthiazole kinase [Tatumella sp. JGM82]MBS0889682.1 hydroxyethylthiazole kinase [Tatumella sp. JGM94]MBS0900804.1 hydroxyethylthiazole kinase [Tatumella sp. JGM100]
MSVVYSSFSAREASASRHLYGVTPPLVHCMTNQVVQSLTANILLASSASPAMVIDLQEAPVMAAHASALLINVGTLTHEAIPAMQAAVESANRAAVPWTLDPVAMGVLPLRSDFCRQLLDFSPAVIRGNGSEVLALAGAGKGGRGMDSKDDSCRAVSAAVQLAADQNCIVVVSGATDYVTDGHLVLTLTGGSPLMTAVTGTGCGLSALVAAFSTLPGNRLYHVATACWLMSQAAEQAAQQSRGPGSFSIALIDALWQLCQTHRQEGQDNAAN